MCIDKLQSSALYPTVHYTYTTVDYIQYITCTASPLCFGFIRFCTFANKMYHSLHTGRDDSTDSAGSASQQHPSMIINQINWGWKCVWTRHGREAENSKMFIKMVYSNKLVLFELIYILGWDIIVEIFYKNTLFVLVICMIDSIIEACNVHRTIVRGRSILIL